jgi:hypothetical protein
VQPRGSAVILAILLRVSSISEEQEGQEDEDDFRMGGQWRKTPRYAGQQGDPSRLWGVWGKKSVTSRYATRAIPRLGCNTINTFTLSCSFLRRVCCAVLQDSTVDIYITVCYHQPARRGAADSAGGAAGRAVLRTSPCTSYSHQSISEAQTAQQVEGQGRWCATYITCTIINSVEYNYQQEMREKLKRRGGCCCAVLCYVAM